MASPQTENGFTKISNELLEAMCMVQLSGNEWSIVHTVIRKTYGYNKKDDWIAISQLCESTGLIKQRVNEAKQKLLAKRILIQKGKKLSLNKNYETWLKSNGKALRSNGKALRKVTEKREYKRKKETVQKKLPDETSGTNKKTNMPWKQYDENAHADDGVIIDDETGDVATDLEAEERKKQTAETRKINDEMRRYIRGLRDGLQFPPLDVKQMNWQLKDYRILLDRGWSHKNIGEAFINIARSDYWTQKVQNGEYPGMNTVESALRNKSPQ